MTMQKILRIMGGLRLLQFVAVVLVAFLLLSGVANAQDEFSTNTPVMDVTATVNGEPVEATLVAPVDDVPAPAPAVSLTFNDILPALLMVIVVLVIGLVGIAGTSLVLLYRSLPPIGQSLISSGVDTLIKQYEARVKETADEFDDKIAAELRKAFDEFMSKASQDSISASNLHAPPQFREG
ncbi:hypothetical protein KDA23_03175 [Candidatus Saccharibacteria bacterium]|nr:hypothetical protein [Candidatus Saccharibacteria bacterium]